MGHLKLTTGHLTKTASGHLAICGADLCCKDTVGLNCTVSGNTAPTQLGTSTRSGSFPFYSWELYRYDFYDYGDANVTWYRDLAMLGGGTKTSSNCYDGFDGNSSVSDITDVLIGEVTERHYTAIEADLGHGATEPVWVESDASGAYSYYLVDHVADLFVRFGPYLEVRLVSKITSSTLTTVGTPAGAAPSGGAGVQSVGTVFEVVGPVFPLYTDFTAKGLCGSVSDTRRIKPIIAGNMGGGGSCAWSPEL